MSRAGSAERREPEGWEAQPSASQPTPLAIVSSALAGEGVERVARAASEALGHPVAVILPSSGAPVVWPEDAVRAGLHDELVAAAAAIARLLGESSGADERRSLVAALVADPPLDSRELVVQARRLGHDLSAGGIAICVRGEGALELLDGGVLLAGAVGATRAAGLIGVDDEGELVALCDRAREAGLDVGVSGVRRDPALLAEAVREAMLLAELACAPDGGFAGQEETMRLLIGVLLRDPGELEQLRASTISALATYDAEHDTELLATLEAFLARHGSTTETAEAMRLHRHTVGYRLSRVQEVSGLSPYESDGRERLSLGLKAAQILEAYERLSQPG